MIKEAIEKILSLAPVEKFNFSGREYASEQLTPVKPPVQSDLDVITLTAIEDYYRDNPDGAALAESIVHVVAPHRVQVLSKVSADWFQRHAYLDATTKPEQFRFGQYISVEQFMISLQTYFVQDATTVLLMQVIGNLVEETSVKVLDDGVTQQVTAKSGIARVADIILPNPVELAPYRTFREIEQPVSKFIFRLKKGNDGTSVALFEADGGNWQNECIIRVRDWLRVHLPTGTTILA